jgi:hypothetical protein
VPTSTRWEEAAGFDQRLAELREDLIEAHAVGKGVKRVEEQMRSLKTRRRDHVPRLMGPRRRRARAEEAVQAYITAHFQELLNEAMPACEKAAKDVQGAIDWLRQARADWEAQAELVSRWVSKPPGIRNNPRYRIPALRLNQLNDALAAVDGNVPLPVPRGLLDHSERIAEIRAQLDAITERYNGKPPSDVASQRNGLQTELRDLDRIEQEKRHLLGIEDEPIAVDAEEAGVA